jgi:hypothetical protein
MSLGTRLHKVLELHYGYGADPRAALGVIYGNLVTDDIDEAIEINKEKTLALTMLDGYLEWAEREGTDYDLTLVSTELDVVVESGAPGIKFRGKLDQVVQRQSDGALLFHDWKTTGSFDMIVPTLHLNPQARFYAMLNLLMAERDALWPRVDGGLFTMLRRTQRTRFCGVFHTLQSNGALITRVVPARHRDDVTGDRDEHCNDNERGVTQGNSAHKDYRWNLTAKHTSHCELISDRFESHGWRCLGLRLHGRNGRRHRPMAEQNPLVQPADCHQYQAQAYER